MVHDSDSRLAGPARLPGSGGFAIAKVATAMSVRQQTRRGSSNQGRYSSQAGTSCDEDSLGNLQEYQECAGLDKEFAELPLLRCSGVDQELGTCRKKLNVGQGLDWRSDKNPRRC